jgi:propanol-preferring alcohol dehydrogenase
MYAMVLHAPGEPLIWEHRPTPNPGPGQVLVRVRACAVCRTDLHLVDGELPHPRLPVIPGHEIVGEVAAVGEGVQSWGIGDRVGVPWLGETCGQCRYCLNGHENLCDEAQFTGYQLDGGYAEFTIAAASACLPIPDVYTDVEAAPLLCAGLIGYRSFKMTEEAQHIGVYGFGAAAHIITQVAVYRRKKIYAFTRPHDVAAQTFALRLGACWAGDATQTPPAELDAAILFAPAGELVPTALRHVAKGGTVVCGGIHMSDIPAFPYSWLWGERVIRSVANLTRRDGAEFMALAPQVPVRTKVTPMPLKEANTALNRLRIGQVTGALVLIPDFHDG